MWFPRLSTKEPTLPPIKGLDSYISTWVIEFWRKRIKKRKYISCNNPMHSTPELQNQTNWPTMKESFPFASEVTLRHNIPHHPIRKYYFLTEKQEENELNLVALIQEFHCSWHACKPSSNNSHFQLGSSIMLRFRRKQPFWCCIIKITV